MTALIVALAIAQSPAPREIGSLKFIVGEWTGSVSGASVNLVASQGPGNRSIRFTLRISGTLIRSFSDEGYIWWDKEAAAYRSHAMSSVSNDPRREIGRLSGGALVMVSEPFEVSGVSERTRRTFSSEAGGLRMKLDMQAGDGWKPAFSTLLKKRR